MTCILEYEVLKTFILLLLVDLSSALLELEGVVRMFPCTR